MDDGVLHRPQGRSGSGRYADLGVDVLDVMVGGLRRDEKPVGDLLRRQPLRREVQHLDLTARQAAGVLRPRRLAGTRFVVAGGREHGAGRAVVESAVNDTPNWMQERIRRIDVEDGNRTKPLNVGFASAAGEYIAVLDDDELARRVVEQMVQIGRAS